MLDKNKCPTEIVQSLTRYVIDGIPTGGFLSAVLENDLKEAFGRADDSNQLCLGHIVAYCYNEIPGDCWGSPERVNNWLKVHAIRRKEANQ